MKNRIAFLGIAFLFFLGCTTATQQKESQIEVELSKLESSEQKQAYLEKIQEDDQTVRLQEPELLRQYGSESKEYQDLMKEWNKQDKINLQKVEKYLEKFGYPDRVAMGRKAALTPWLVIHHNVDVAIRNKYFALFYKAYLDGNIEESAMALYLGRTYHKTFGKLLRMENPYTGADEIKQLIKELKLENRK